MTKSLGSRAASKLKRKQAREERNQKYVNELRERATPAELIVKAYLDSINADYIFQHGILKPFHRIYDFYFPGLNAALEIDGSAHIGNELKDYKKDRQLLMQNGTRTYRITNSAVFFGRHKQIISDIFSGVALMAIKPSVQKFEKSKKIKLRYREPSAREKKGRKPKTKVVVARQLKPRTAKQMREEKEVLDAFATFYRAS